MKLGALFLLVLAQAVAPPQFRSGVNFVEVDVVVADRSGVPVRGLRREDFEVTEDGRPVELLTFSAVDVPAAAPAAVIPPLDRSGTSVAANDQPEDGRVLLIVLDDYHVSFDAGRAATSRAIANKLVERMGPSDLVAVMSTSGQRSTQAEFTSDKAKLLEAIKGFFPQSEASAGGIAERRAPASGGRGGGGGGMGFVAGIKARWAMETLSSAATGLALIPHRRKAVLLVTQGLPVSVEDIISNSHASDAFQALRDFILTAQRSNIAVYTMDPCGLDMTDGCSTYSRQNLQTLAEATGGFAVTNTNAPERGVDRMIAETGTYYLIGYSSPAPPYDGKRHRIKVRTREPGHQVRARESYITPRRAPQAKAAPAAIDALVEAPIQSRGLTMRIAAVPAPLATKPGATVAVGIELLTADAARAESIDFTLAAIDSNGKVYSRQRSRSTFQAKGAPPTGWARLGSRVDVPPGRYQIRLAAVGGNGVGGSVFTEVTVPKFTDDLAIGGLSLGSPALRTEERAELIAGVLPLVPLATREFPAATSLVAQLPIRATAKGAAAIKIETRLLRNDRDPMVLPPPAGAQVGFTGPAGAVYQVPLPPNLDAGAYRVIVDVTSGRDRATREVSFRVLPKP
jgi:VWFA-related protein